MANYPKDIEDVDYKVSKESTGFTLTEKIALQSGWKIIKARLRKNATEIFLDFFTTHSEYLNMFYRPMSKFDLHLLHAHPYIMLNSIGMIIEEGLENGRRLNLIMADLSKVHTASYVTRTDIALMMDFVNRSFKQILKRYMSPTLSNAIDKLCTKLIAGFD